MRGFPEEKPEAKTVARLIEPVKKKSTQKPLRKAMTNTHLAGKGIEFIDEMYSTQQVRSKKKKIISSSKKSNKRKEKEKEVKKENKKEEEKKKKSTQKKKNKKHKTITNEGELL